MSPINERLLHRRHRDLLRRLGDHARRMREDAGRSQAAVARAAGISAGYYCEIEAGHAEPSLLVLERVSAALGADFVARFFEGFGPRIRDHLQAPMTNELLRVSRAAWAGRVEVVVYRPVHGVIDTVLEERRGPATVAAEIHSQLRRVEQQIRWQTQKADALGAMDDQQGRRVSRLLVLRNTQQMRDAVRSAGELLAAAYPASTADAVAALRGELPWPGPALTWMTVEGGRAHLLDRPPRGIMLGS